MIRWKYNRFGHVEIWGESNKEPRESDIYLQVDTDVQSFFEQIGIDPENVNVEDSDTCKDLGYF